MKGRPVLGAFAGLLFGLFLAITLQQFGVYPLTSVSVIGFPVAGIALGLLMAGWAPFRRITSGPAGE